MSAQGWLCPGCGRGLAPGIATCDHGKASVAERVKSEPAEQLSKRTIDVDMLRRLFDLKGRDFVAEPVRRFVPNGAVFYD